MKIGIALQIEKRVTSRRDFCEGDRGGSTYGKCVT